MYPAKMFKLAVGSEKAVVFKQLPSENRLLIELVRQMRQQGRVVLKAGTYHHFILEHLLSVKGAYCYAVYAGRVAVRNPQRKHQLRREYNATADTHQGYLYT